MITNINNIKSKYELYINQEKGSVIKNPNELNFISTTYVYAEYCEVFISNKSLKHFIERRKEDLCKKHLLSYKDIIFNMLEILPLFISEYDFLLKNKQRENSLIFYKDIGKGVTKMACVLEKINSKLYIISIQLIKQKAYDKNKRESCKIKTT